jgi:hypothetical protein
LLQTTVNIADTVVEIYRCSRTGRTVSGIAHATEINRSWGGEEVEVGASVGEILFVVIRVEDLAVEDSADDNAQSDKNKRNNSRELHLEVVWYICNGYCLMVECFLFRSRKRKGVMVVDEKVSRSEEKSGLNRSPKEFLKFAHQFMSFPGVNRL